jgi:hypothetical protein
VPSSWDYTDDTLDATRFNLAATQDRLIDGMTMVDYFYLYKESSIYRMNYVGGNTKFSLSDPISTEAGALALNCIGEFPGGHLVLGQSDIFINDGSTVQSAIDGRMRRWLQANLDAMYYGRSFVASNPTKGEIWVCLPQTGATVPNLALIWNWKENKWTFRDLPGAHHAAAGVIDATATESWDSDGGSWDSDSDPWNYNEYTQASRRLIIADDSTRLFLTDSSRQFDGVNFRSYIERTGIDFDAPNWYKRITFIKPRFEGTSGEVVQVSIGGTDDLEDAVMWADPFDFTIGEDFQADFDFDEFRYMAIRFESAVSTTWRLKSFSVDYEITSEY